MRVNLFALFFIALMSGISVNAQHCYTTEVYNELVKQHPEVLKTQAELEQFTQQYIAGQAERRETGTIYIIPMVFHIIHNYGPEDISDEQVLDAVRILNLDYRKLNADTNQVVAAFKPIAADCGIQFRLANIDPSGKCTNGIDRVVSSLTYNADDASKLNPWPASKYLNIWVVNSLSAADAAAYSYYPGTVPASIDGVIARYTYVGSIGTSNSITSRTLTHEIGHFLNLEHTWGNSNAPGVACGDDGVNDTPVTMGWQTCNVKGATCGNAVDNVQNYMEYSYCTNMFTQGQKSRMTAALNSSISGRNNLWTSANATATGISGAPIACAPKADFAVTPSFVCMDQQVQFTDLSWNGQVTSWNWSFPGGTPSTSTDSMPVINYSSPGNYNVSLTVSNSKGSTSATKNSIVLVSGAAKSSVPYSQDFEMAGSFPGSGGIIMNPDNGTTWVWFSTAGSSGNASFMIRNYNGNTPGQIDSYVTQGFNLSNLTQPWLTFRVANAQRTTASNDRLKVYLSTDCGTTWVQKYNKSGSKLATAGIITTSFTPNKSQWRTDSVNLALYAGSPNVRFKFENTSGSGNNTYIDDININGTVGIDEINPSSINFEIYPNPSHGESIISFDLLKEGNTEIHVLDVMGREVQQVSAMRLNAGIHQFTVSSSNFAKGIYFVELLIDGNRAVKKMVVD